MDSSGTVETVEASTDDWKMKIMHNMYSGSITYEQEQLDHKQHAT
jgi:hypothetical protein